MSPTLWPRLKPFKGLFSLFFIDISLEPILRQRYKTENGFNKKKIFQVLLLRGYLWVFFDALYELIWKDSQINVFFQGLKFFSFSYTILCLPIVLIGKGSRKKVIFLMAGPYVFHPLPLLELNGPTKKRV